MTAVAAAAVDRSQLPGALEVQLRRELPNGSVIEFESAPAGWLTKKGERRQADWRAYFFTRAGGKRVRYPSVTTLLDAVCPKGGLPRWAEARGIEGALRAVRMGELDPLTYGDRQAVDRVRELKLGADRARDVAAERGLNVHDCLRVYMETGSPPNPADHPDHHQGYLRALIAWLLDARPEPEAVEQLVVNPKDRYAGRLDLIAQVNGINGPRVLYDAKTQENCGIYEAAHLQVRLYERARVMCGDDPADELRLVVFAANGEYREMSSAADERHARAALRFYREMRPVISTCESLNRLERQARKPQGDAFS